jgi:bacteriochlorophyll 4-vinyl reductase
LRESASGRDAGSRVVAVPAVTLAALGRALRDQAGALTAIHSLHAAGYETGGPVFEAFMRTLPRPVAAMPEKTFWDALSRFFEKRGWGTLVHSSPHDGVGLLSSRDWVEADGRKENQPVCAFSSGLFAHLLTRVADGPVAVLEVSCRAHRDVACRFAFGSEVAIHDLYGMLLEGKDIQQAFAEL